MGDCTVYRRAVAAVLAEFPALTEVDLLGKSRVKGIVAGKMLLYTLLREFSLMSWPEIARECHRPNHSTCITAYRRLQRHLDRPILVWRGASMSEREMTFGATVERCRMRMRGLTGHALAEFARSGIEEPQEALEVSPHTMPAAHGPDCIIEEAA